MAQDPGAPTGLTISNETSNGFTLSWDADPNATGGTNIFIVEPSAGSGDVYIATVAAGVTTFDYSGTYGSVTIQSGGTYIAKIQALPDGDGNAFADTTVTLGVMTSDPDAPTGLTISNETSDGFTLSWDADPNATGGTNIFIVEPSAGSGDVYIATVAAGVTTFDYSGTYGSVTIQSGGTYIAKIQALPDGDGNAFADTTVTLGGMTADPDAPTGLTISNETSNGFTLSWDADSNATGGTNIFIVEPSANSGDVYITTVPAGVTTFDYSGTYGSVTINNGVYIAKIQALPDGDGNAFADIEVNLQSLSVEDLLFADDEAFKVFPNPTKDEIKLQLNAFFKVSKIALIGLDGKLIKYYAPDNKINLNDVSNGIYILAVEDEKGVQIFKKIQKI